VTSRGHQDLSVFGLLREASVDEVRGYIDQIVTRGLLRQTEDAFPVLRMTSEGVALLKDPAILPDLALVRQRKPQKGKAPARSRQETESWEGVDRELFTELRAMRQAIARDRRVPPYVVFHDTTLRELARLQPTTLDELRHVYGVGARKTEELGEVILEAIRQHRTAGTVAEVQ
jgi:ATP-dependent DNA helicase RecQ